jgi:hypothetical protein
MQYVQSVPAETKSVASTFSNRRRLRNIFAAIIDALHHARRLQAQRVLIQYGHLIDRSERCIVCETTRGAGGEHADK